jgi:hypothetical protein
MKGCRGMVAGLVLGMLCAASLAEARSWVVPPRPGQLGAGIDGQYGSLAHGGALGSEFGSGGGLSVRLRYRMRYERAIGVSFERQSFEARHPADSLFADKTLTLMNSSAEFYQLFGTRTATTRMLSVGFGLTQVSKKLRDGEIKLGGEDVTDGGFVSVGAGIERFVFQSLGFDLNTHYQVVFQNGSTNHGFQVALGLIFYASY